MNSTCQANTTQPAGPSDVISSSGSASLSKAFVDVQLQVRALGSQLGELMISADADADDAGETSARVKDAGRRTVKGESS